MEHFSFGYEGEHPWDLHRHSIRIESVVWLWYNAKTHILGGFQAISVISLRRPGDTDRAERPLLARFICMRSIMYERGIYIFENEARR